MTSLAYSTGLLPSGAVVVYVETKAAALERPLGHDGAQLVSFTGSVPNGGGNKPGWLVNSQ
jgi:hypothetical protein